MTRTLNSAAWDGRVIFMTRHASFGTLEQAGILEQQLKDACPDLFEKLDFPTVSYLLSMTVDIEFVLQGDEGTMILDLMDFWGKWKKKSNVSDAIEWRKFTGIEVIIAWVKAVNESGTAIRRPEQLPPSAWTPEEREEAADPESPLAEPEPSS